MNRLQQREKRWSESNDKEGIPLDVVSMVLGFLNVRDLANLASTNKAYHFVICSILQEKLFALTLNPMHLESTKITQICHSMIYNRPHVTQPLIACGESHTCVVSRVNGSNRSIVYTFGEGEFGQLGNNDTVHQQEPGRIALEELCGNSYITTVACGSNHTALLTSNGRVITFGDNEYGQCGDVPSLAIVPSVLALQGMESLKFHQLVAGQSYTAAITSTGRIALWGQLHVDTALDPENPLLLALGEISSDDFVEQIAAGSNHMLILTRQRKVYAVGNGVFGKLGVHLDATAHPIQVAIPSSAPITQVSAGHNHSAAVSGSGELFMWGSSVNGESGVGKFCKEVTIPTRVDIPAFAVQVSCGKAHTVVLSSSGKVLTFGSGSFQQNGQNCSFWATNSPNEISCGNSVKQYGDVIGVVAGGKHTVLFTDNDEVVMFGDHRCCGSTSSMTPSFVPKPLVVETRIRRVWSV